MNTYESYMRRLDKMEAEHREFAAAVKREKRRKQKRKATKKPLNP